MPPIRNLSKNLFAPPYRLLPLAVFAYIVLCFILHPLSPIRTGVLGDPDDYMRLNEVINWLQGQGWHDLSHPRLSPGAHTVVHWSRLVDLPLALIMLPFVHAFGIANAAMIASFIVPPLLLGLLLVLVASLAKVFTGGERANLATLFLLFAPVTLFNFVPGRVDHHGYQVLIAGFGLFCLDPILNDKRGWRFAILAALGFACGLWIGTEILPWLILFTACLAGIAVWQGGFAARNAAVFGVTLALAAVAILPLALPPQEFSSRALSWFSSADVIFSALAGGMLIVGWLLTQARRCSPPLAGGARGGGVLHNQMSELRNAPPPNLPRKGGGTDRSVFQRILCLSLIAALEFLAAIPFFVFVPDALVGPYADYDNFNSTIALANITEAQPLMYALRIQPGNSFTYAPVVINFLRYILLPLLALGFICHRLRAAPKNLRTVWAAHGIFLLAALLLTVFWQVRVGWFMQLFMIAPLTGLLCAWWDKIRLSLKGRPRFLAETGAFLLLGVVPVVLLPAAFHDAKFYSDVLLFPAARAEGLCHLKPAAEFLAEPWGYGGQIHTILSGSGEGPELLFRTPHNVVAANFDVAGNRDVYDFFNAHDDRQARAILRKWHADMVLTCRHISPFYAGRDHPRFGANIFLRPGKDGKLVLGGDQAHPAMIDRLVYGTPPAWLKPVEIPGNSDYLLFEITGKQ